MSDKPVYVWEHRIDGKVIGEVRRFTENNNKSDLPYYKSNGHGFALGGPPKPYPLLGLDSIKDRNLPVIVCEGQKKQLIWQSLGYQCVTSLFGSGSANHSDWRPIADIQTIWLAPDKDTAGISYAKSVWSILHKQNPNCTVSLLSLPNLKEKGDVCDWLKNLPELADWNTYDPLTSHPQASSLRTALAISIKSSLRDIPVDWEPVEEWTSEPHELATPLIPVTRMPLDMVPLPLQPWVSDIIMRMQCPLEYVAIGAIVMIAAAIGASCTIRPKQKDDWTVVPNLWGIICSPPGTKKTPALKDAILPLQLIDNKWAAQSREAQKQYEIDLAAWKANNKPAQESRSKYTKKFPEEEPEPMPESPPAKRCMANDATMEALAKLMQANPRGLLLYQDEINQLISGWSKPEKESERSFYLSAWNGDVSYSADRITREGIRVDNMCLSLLGSIQPDKLRTSLVRTTDTANDGLLQRFQLAVYLTAEECAAMSPEVDEAPNYSERSRVHDLIETICNSSNYAAYLPSYDNERSAKSTLPYFNFTSDAQKEFYEWLTENRQKATNEDDSYLGEHLSKYPSLCASLALIFHIIDCVTAGTTGPIQVHNLRLACAWCGLLEEHARRIYATAIPGELRGAHELAKHIKAGRLSNPFRLWEVQQKNWRMLQKKEQIKSAIEVLEEYNWLKKVVTEPSTRGGARKTEYWINPQLDMVNDG